MMSYACQVLLEANLLYRVHFTVLQPAEIQKMHHIPFTKEHPVYNSLNPSVNWLCFGLRLINLIHSICFMKVHMTTEYLCTINHYVPLFLNI